MSGKIDKAAEKAKLEKDRDRYLKFSYIVSGTAIGESDEEAEDEVEEEGKGKGKIVQKESAVTDKSLIQSLDSFSIQEDPTKEFIWVFVAGSQKPRSGYRQVDDWVQCHAKFDSGADDDWISEELATGLGFKSKQAETWECHIFDGNIFTSDKCVGRLTWIREGTVKGDAPQTETKTISGPFRIMPNAPFEILIGRKTLFGRKIFDKKSALILVVKKPTKKQREEDAVKAAKQDAESEALLAEQSLAKKKKRLQASVLARNNKPGGAQQP